VYAPAIKRLFSTDQNGKSYETVKLSAKAGQTINKPLRVSAPDANALSVVASKSHINFETTEYIAKYSVLNYKNAGSSLKFCLIANGEADFYPRLGRTMEWDTAAGHAILSGAGGYVTNLFTKEPLFYGKPSFENPFFVAHSKKSLIKY
jgi:3'(2'), 5'-bisphosphate nucleotidase